MKRTCVGLIFSAIFLVSITAFIVSLYDDKIINRYVKYSLYRVVNRTEEYTCSNVTIEFQPCYLNTTLVFCNAWYWMTDIKICEFISYTNETFYEYYDGSMGSHPINIDMEPNSRNCTITDSINYVLLDRLTTMFTVMRIVSGIIFFTGVIILCFYCTRTTPLTNENNHPMSECVITNNDNKNIVSEAPNKSLIANAI